MKPSETTDWVTVQTRLLRDPELRARFRRDPAGLARDMGLGPTDAELLARLCPDQLDAQARTLVDKRLHEAFQLLPGTVANLGSGARSLFISHALRYWPEGHQRHTLDALEFCNTLPNEFQDFIDQREINRLRFRIAPSQMRVHWISRRSLSGSRFLGIHVLFQRRRQLRQLQFGIALPEFPTRTKH